MLYLYIAIGTLVGFVSGYYFSRWRLRKQVDSLLEKFRQDSSIAIREDYLASVINRADLETKN